MPVTISPVTISPVTVKAVMSKAVMFKALMIKVGAVTGAVMAQPGPGTHTAVRALGVAALITWLLDAGSGGYMLVTWVRRGGPRALIAAGDRLAPSLVFSHFGLASTGLLLWACYVATLAPALAWVAVTLLIVVIGLGISTVTLWTPFPAHGAAPDEDPRTVADGGGEPDQGGVHPPAGLARSSLTGRLTDDVLERALTDEALLGRLVDDVIANVPGSSGPGPAGTRAAGKPRQRRPQVLALIPAGHGVAAMATVLLAVLTAVIAR
jgi:hypothetical protein